MNGSIQLIKNARESKQVGKKINNLPDIVSEIQVGKLFQGEEVVEFAMVSGVDGLPRHIPHQIICDLLNFCVFCQKI